MGLEKKVCFDSKDRKSHVDIAFVKKFILPNLILIVIILIPIVLKKLDFDLLNSPIFYLIAGIVLIQFAIFRIIKFYSRKVTGIQFENNFITIIFKRGNAVKSEQLFLHSCIIELFELKNHKSFFVGMQLNIKDENKNTKYKILESEWDYLQMELIYNEFKKRKNEIIPDNELSVYNQLQLMNETSEKLD